MDRKMVLIENTESDGPDEAIHSEQMGSMGQREGEPEDEIGPQFYTLPFGMKPALLMLTAFVVGAAVVGASINEGMRGHVVGTSVLANSTDSLWSEYPSVSTSCLGAIQKCRVRCYHEELECYKKGKEQCAQLRELCMGTNRVVEYDKKTSVKQADSSCLSLRQECERTALCFQGHQFCHVSHCFGEFIQGGSTTFKRAARMVWTEKANIYDECVHSTKSQTTVANNLKGVKILKGGPSPTADGCNDDMERCLMTHYEKELSDTQGDIEKVVIAPLDPKIPIDPFKPAVNKAFKPTNYREKSCESQEAACRANCHEGSSAISQINLVAVHIELTPLQCETQCAEIGKICAAFEKCSADYQQCEAATCAPKVGGPYKFDKTLKLPWTFTDPHGKEFVKCKDGCLRNLESCFQSVGPACTPDAESQYCELPA